MKSVKEIIEANKCIYPLTIIRDRYNGTYSGGKYLAFYQDYYDITEDIDGDDVTCATWWAKNKDAVIVGRGATPNEAEEDLKQKLLTIYGDWVLV